MTSVLLAALACRGVKRRRARKDWIKILVKLRLVSMLIETDAKKNLKPCQTLFLCVFGNISINLDIANASPFAKGD